MGNKWLRQEWMQDFSPGRGQRSASIRFYQNFPKTTPGSANVKIRHQMVQKYLKKCFWIEFIFSFVFQSPQNVHISPAPSPPMPGSPKYHSANTSPLSELNVHPGNLYQHLQRLQVSKLLSYGLGPVYTKLQHQRCDDACDTVLIEINGNKSVSLQNGIATNFGVTQLMSIRTTSQTPSQCWLFVDAYSWCKRTHIHTARDRDKYREWDCDQWILIYCTEMFTLVWDRDINQDPLFPIVLAWFPVPVLIPVLCPYSVYNGSFTYTETSPVDGSLSQKWLQ